MPIRHRYSDTSRPMLLALRRRGLLDTEAFAAWIGEATGEPVCHQLVSQWVTGDAHLPADALPLLVDFVGDEALVLGAYHRAHHLAAPQVPEEAAAERRLALGMARLQVALIEARDPTSGGGGELSDAERQEHIRQAENLGREIEQYLSALRANVARPRVVAGGRR